MQQIIFFYLTQLERGIKNLTYFGSNMTTHDTRSAERKTLDATIDIITNPTNSFAGGNWAAISSQTPTILDHSIAGGTLAATMITTAMDSWRGRKPNTPFYTLAGVNTALSATTAANASFALETESAPSSLGIAVTIDKDGLAAELGGNFTEAVTDIQNGDLNIDTFTSLFELSSDNQSAAALSIALAGWALGHYMTAREIQSGTKPPTTFQNGQIHYGYADATAVHIGSTQLNIPALACMSLGLTCALLDEKINASGIPDFIKDQVTPPRIYAASYLAGAIAMRDNPQMMLVASSVNSSKVFCGSIEESWKIKGKVVFRKDLIAIFGSSIT